MEFRRLGKTGYNVSILTLGGCGPGYVNQETADIAVQKALDAGVNFFDIAPSYGDAEVRLRPWVEKMRDKIIIAEKTTERSKEGARGDLENSLNRLGTDYFDMYQFHAVGTMSELDEILGKGGAMETFQEAKETGMIKHIGITGHQNMEVFMEALNRYDFDTILLPVNAASMIHPHPHNDFRPLLDLAEERDVGIVAIKAILKRRWNSEEEKKEKSYNTWYHPLETQEAIDKAVWYTLSQKVTTIPLSCDVKLWDKIISAVERFKPLDADEQNTIVKWAGSQGMKPIFPHS
ncbi:MAG: aldo/keto reductase [Candidatus Heimdallarchaeota archaeon]|nr:aldo/keto reductase [Candidatus Heimdallarchaeota archaeon]